MRNYPKYKTKPFNPKQSLSFHRVMWYSVMIASLTVGISQSVYADTFLLRSDSLQFRPSMWLSSDYDDNVFYESDVEPNGNVPNQGAVLKLGGGLSIENRGSSPVALNIDATSAYRHYIFLNDENGKGEQLVDQLRQGRNGIDFARLNGQLTLGALSDVQVILKDRFSYIERPAYEGTVFGFERVDNRLGAAVDFAPGRRGGGGPLGINLGYELRSVFFLNDGVGLDIQRRSEKQAHTISLDTRWKFLPKNFLTLDISYTSNDYNDFEDEDGIDNAELVSRDSTPLRAELGISGLVTTRISVFLKGGYSNTYNKNGESFEGFVGLFQLSYVVAPVSEISVGYQRDGQDSGFSNFYHLDRFFTKAAFNLSQRLTLTGNVSYDIYSYNSANAIDNASRVDPVLRSQIAIRTVLPSNLSVKVAYSIEANYTDYELPIDNPTDFASYQRQLFSLSLYFN